MKIKSRVWYWLAAASGTASLLYGMGIEGGAQLGSSISDNQFVTALCLVLAAVAFLRLGFAAQDREQNARRYGRVDRTHARTEEPDYRKYRGRQLYGPILCYGWKGNNIQPMNKDVQTEMLDRLKGTEVKV